MTICAAGMATALTTSNVAFAAGNVAHGEVLYQRCQQCHSIEQNRVGPRHKGVFGRVAGTQPGYEYSMALKRSGIVWNEDTLDRWLTNPQTFIPGVSMFYQLGDPQDRADVIEFLKEKAK
jgi:cytochrome c